MIRLDNVTIAYQRCPAVCDLSGIFAHGSLTAVVGPNGAGKSSLLAALAGQLSPIQGCVNIDDRARQRIAYLPQQADIDRSFPITVFDVVMLGHWHRLRAFKRATAAMRQRALKALSAVGLHHCENRLIHELSIGQFQRVLFARLLLQNAAVILLDEPFNAVDARTTADLLGMVKHWHRHRCTVIAVLHDLDQVREHFPDTLLMARKTVAWGATRDVLSADNLSRARKIAEHWDEQAMPREYA
jgi:zinc/manganese transport system ATP-binding protein